MPEIGLEELECLMTADSVTIVDVREEWEYRRAHVAG